MPGEQQFSSPASFESLVLHLWSEEFPADPIFPCHTKIVFKLLVPAVSDIQSFVSLPIPDGLISFFTESQYYL